MQENEKEEKQNEELRRRSRRIQSNRRSLEADSGKYSSLSVLHMVVACQVQNIHMVSSTDCPVQSSDTLWHTPRIFYWGVGS